MTCPTGYRKIVSETTWDAGCRDGAWLCGPENEVGDSHGFLFLNVSDVAHHNVDQGILHQAEEHENRTPRHEHVNGLEKILAFLLSSNILTLFYYLLQW